MKTNHKTDHKIDETARNRQERRQAKKQIDGKASREGERYGERVLVSCDPEFANVALQELREMLPDMPVPLWVDDGIALCTPRMTFASFAALMQEKSPIFVRHIAPVQQEIPLQGEAVDVEAMAAAVCALSGQIDPSQTFAVQARFLSDMPRPYRKFTVNETLSARLSAETGAAMECKTPVQIVSVLCTLNTAYVGISRAVQNRSDWPGGEHRFKRDDEQISRAEFKLLEAIDVFGLEFPAGGKALDMGAAPGGWTRVLRQLGIRVVAVDPADMDIRFRGDPNVTRVATTIEAFLPAVKTRFDLIVNDMRMDADESVERMLKASKCLLPGCLGVMTFKLPHTLNSNRDTLTEIRQALERLSRDYRIIGARQLYHNRSEVTVAMKARGT